jgi:hypothetical protein
MEKSQYLLEVRAILLKDSTGKLLVKDLNKILDLPYKGSTKLVTVNSIKKELTIVLNLLNQNSTEEAQNRILLVKRELNDCINGVTLEDKVLNHFAEANITKLRNQYVKDLGEEKQVFKQTLIAKGNGRYPLASVKRYKNCFINYPDLLLVDQQVISLDEPLDPYQYEVDEGVIGPLIVSGDKYVIQLLIPKEAVQDFKSFQVERVFLLHSYGNKNLEVNNLSRLRALRTTMEKTIEERCRLSKDLIRSSELAEIFYESKIKVLEAKLQRLRMNERFYNPSQEYLALKSKIDVCKVPDLKRRLMIKINLLEVREIGKITEKIEELESKVDLFNRLIKRVSAIQRRHSRKIELKTELLREQMFKKNCKVVAK